MGTTRIKVIDLSSSQQEIKTSRKHAEKLAGVPKLEKEEKEKRQEKQAEEAVPQDQTAETETTQPDKNLASESETKAEEAKKAAPASLKKKAPGRHRGSNYEKAKKLVEDKLYSAQDALELLPKTSFTKFDPAVEMHLGVSEKNIKGSVNFPHLEVKTKDKKYLVFSEKKPQANAKNVTFANEKTIDDLESGKIKPGRDFDTVIASPKFMPALAKVAKILGPRGMMPNPKNGTVTENFEKVLEDTKTASTLFKTDPSSPVVHIKIGKLSQKQDELTKNMKALVLAIGTSKIKKATITTTMGPAIKLDPASL